MSLMWRTRRRTVIVLIILSVFLVVVVLPYWLLHRTPPTCTDGKQNQDEKGIDCGGTCALVCPGGAKDLRVVWTKMFPIRKGAYDVVAYVENPNFAIGAPTVSYTARLFDDSGTLVAEKKGDTFANPGERFAIFAGNLLTGEKKPVRGTLELAPVTRWLRDESAKLKLSVGEKVLVGTEKVPKLSATLGNGEPLPVREIEVTAVIYDTTGNPVASSATEVEKIDAKGSARLFFTWPGPFAYVAETEKCEKPVDVILVLDRSGTMQSESKNPAQPLTDAIEAAKDFVDRLTPEDQAAYISFATNATNPIDQVLTNKKDLLKRAIDRTKIGSDGLQKTNIGDALKRAMDELATFRANPDAKQVVVLLTDGDAKDSIDPNSKDPKEYPSQYAFAMDRAVKEREISLYTIGLGSASRGGFIEDFATKPEYYYSAPTRAELSDVYQEIATAICKKGPSVIEIIPRVESAALTR